MEKRCGDAVLNCNERLGHCSSLQRWPTAMQSGCLGQGIALQCYAMKPLPLRLLCSRLRLRPTYAPASAIAFSVGQKLSFSRFAVVGRLVGSTRLHPARPAAPPSPGTEALRVPLWLK